MSTETIATVEKPSKKDARRQIYQKLEQALGEYRSQMKEKRFETNLKKASRLFAAELAKNKKNKAKEEKTRNKKAKKKKEEFATNILNSANGIA